MKKFSVFTESTKQDLKIGDRIRTKLGGQTPGIITKIEGDKIYFDHATATYQTVWSGAKGKPKQYVAHRSNVVKEEISEAASGPTRMELQQDFDKLVGSTNQKISAIEKSHKVKNIKLNSKGQIVNFELNERCWDGYKPTPGVKPYEKGSCMKEDDEDIQEEAEHEGKKVTLNKPFRTPDGPKKFAVYVKNEKGNVVKVTFGDPDMEIKRDSDERRSNFRARHNCDTPGPKWKARYWSCKMWSNKPVSKIAESSTNYDTQKTESRFYQLAKKYFGKEVYDTDFNYSPNTGYSTFVINDRKVDVARSKAAKFHLTIEHLNDKEGYFISSFTPYYQGREVFYQEMYKFFLTHKTFADLDDALSFAKKVYTKEIADPKRYKTHVKRFADENLPAGTKLKMTEAKNSFDFSELDGPKTKRVVGGVVGLSGTSPEDALTTRFKSMGYQDIVVTNSNDVIIVSATTGKNKEKNYYKLKKSVSEVVSSNSK